MHSIVSVNSALTIVLLYEEAANETNSQIGCLGNFSQILTLLQVVEKSYCYYASYISAKYLTLLHSPDKYFFDSCTLVMLFTELFCLVYVRCCNVRQAT